MLETPVRQSRAFWLALAVLVAVGLGVRLMILASPLGELDADEAVVGLMARHIAFLGERPVFYYNQQYLGSLEAFTAAPLFLLFNSSTLLLKLVPTAYSLGFLVAMALLARRLFGDGPALITAAYLALPPVMWAVWSTKSRGGYAEVLFLGSLFLLLTLRVADRPRWSRWLLWGLVGGLAFWTHLIAIVYLLPVAVYLGVLALRGQLKWSWSGVALATLAFAAGMGPMLAYNVANGFPTIASLLQPPDLPFDPRGQFFRFFRVGLPVLAGLAQPTTSTDMFDRDWLLRPAGNLAIAALFLLALAAMIAIHLPSVLRLFGINRGWESLVLSPQSSVLSPRSSLATRDPRPVTCDPFRPQSSPAPSLLVLVALVVPPVVAFTRFGFFVSEPRYALPLYSVVPLVAYALWRLPRWWRGAAILGLLALNVWSIISSNPAMWRPEEALPSTASTRAELVRWLLERDRHQAYTDYWVAYPIMFETRETVLAYAASGGFNRYIPAADNVRRTPDAAWVFIPGQTPERDFATRLILQGATAVEHDVSVYHVYTNIDPPTAALPLPCQQHNEC